MFLHLTAAIREHALLLVICAVYFAAAAAFFHVTGLFPYWAVRWVYVPFAWLFAAASLLWLMARPVSRNFEHVVGAIVVALLAAPFQSTFNSLKQIIDDVRGFPWDVSFSQVDRWLHFGRYPWEWVSPIVRSADAIRLIDIAYMLWFPALFGFLFWLAWSGNRGLRRRGLIATALVWMLCGNVAAFLFASAGPCYFGAVVPGTNPYDALTTLLDTHHQQQFLLARSNQIGLWDAMTAQIWLPFGGISAMPSVHVAMAVLMALVVREHNRTAGILASCFAVAVQIGSVVLGWHYSIDGYAGALMAYGIWRTTSWLLAKTPGARLEGVSQDHIRQQTPMRARP